MKAINIKEMKKFYNSLYMKHPKLVSRKQLDESIYEMGLKVWDVWGNEVESDIKL